MDHTRRLATLEMPAAAPEPAHNDHNVYVLGAGFSCDAALPLMDSFLDYMRSVLDELDAARYPGSVEAIHAVLRFRMEAASAAHRANLNPDNIEELFSLASATNEPGPAR